MFRDGEIIWSDALGLADVEAGEEATPDPVYRIGVSVLAQEAPDCFRVVEGRERGEVVRVVRDVEGLIVKLYFATYPLTRDPAAFG